MVVWGLFCGSHTLRNSCELQTLYLASPLTPRSEWTDSAWGCEGGGWEEPRPFPPCSSAPGAGPHTLHCWQYLRRPSNLPMQTSTLSPCAPWGAAQIWGSSHSGQVCPPRAHAPLSTSRRKGPPGALGLGEVGPNCFWPSGPTPRGLRSFLTQLKATVCRICSWKSSRTEGVMARALRPEHGYGDNPFRRGRGQMGAPGLALSKPGGHRAAASLPTSDSSCLRIYRDTSSFQNQVLGTKGRRSGPRRLGTAPDPRSSLQSGL